MIIELWGKFLDGSHSRVSLKTISKCKANTLAGKQCDKRYGTINIVTHGFEELGALSLNNT